MLAFWCKVWATWNSPGAEAWQPTPDPQATAEDAAEDNARLRATQKLGTNITALSASGQTVYAGAADGRIWVSLDAGGTWTSFAKAGRERACRAILCRSQ